MGSSAKRKKEKKKDFQKAKLKVGKAKPKPENQTDTNFRAKAIVLNQQSLQVSAPTIGHQFQHHLSLLSSRSDSQRKESLAYLSTFIASFPVNEPLPVPSGTLFDKVCPSLLDGSSGVRSQFLKLMQSLRVEEVRDQAARLLPYIRAGMTHLSRDIRVSTIDSLSWVLGIAGEEIVSSPGGWQKTLESFVTLLGWSQLQDPTKWSAQKVSFATDTKSTARIMQVLDGFLKVGLEDNSAVGSILQNDMSSAFPLWHTNHHLVSTKSNPFAQLKLFGSANADGAQILEDRSDRLQVFNEQFRLYVQYGINAAKQEGGELGRAAGLLTKTLSQTATMT